MLRIAYGHRVDDRITNDPRFSKAQREALRSASASDEQASLVGLDSKLRPVVSARLGAPRRRVTYALLRNGEPTKVTPPLTERWTNR